MSIINTDLSFFKKLNINISGSWKDVARNDWEGTAISTEPLVALSILKIENKYEWCKSERGSLDGQPIRLLLSPYDSHSPDVKINFSVGRGHVISGCIMPEKRYQPPLLLKNVITTGHIEKTFFIEGSKNVELYSLFLAASDVKVGRNGLWHIRDEYKNKLLEPFDTILTFGRNGEFENT